MSISKKIIAVGCASVMMFSGLCANAAYEPASNVGENSVCVTMDAPVGTIYDLGNGYKFKVIDTETYKKFIDEVNTESMARSSKNVLSLSSLSGRSSDHYFTLTSTYKYWHIAMCNNQSTSYSTKITVFTPDGDIDMSVSVKGGGTAGNIGFIYSEEARTGGDYMVRFSSLYEMVGSAYGKIGTTASDVVYEG